MSSLSLVHYSGISLQGNPPQRSLLLTAKDGRRRAWSAVLIFDEGPLVRELERVLTRSMQVSIEEIGAISIDGAVVDARAAAVEDRRVLGLASVTELKPRDARRRAAP